MDMICYNGYNTFVQLNKLLIERMHVNYGYLGITF